MSLTNSASYRAREAHVTIISLAQSVARLLLRYLSAHALPTTCNAIQQGASSTQWHRRTMSTRSRRRSCPTRSAQRRLLSCSLIPQSRFSGDGADLILLHWLRHAEQAIASLSSVSDHQMPAAHALKPSRKTSSPLFSPYTPSSSRSSYPPLRPPCPSPAGQYATSSRNVWSRSTPRSSPGACSTLCRRWSRRWRTTMAAART